MKQFEHLKIDGLTTAQKKEVKKTLSKLMPYLKTFTPCPRSMCEALKELHILKLITKEQMTIVLDLIDAELYEQQRQGLDHDWGYLFEPYNMDARIEWCEEIVRTLGKFRF